MRTKKTAVGSRAVRGIEEVKANNVLPFGQHSVKLTQIIRRIKIQQKNI